MKIMLKQIRFGKVPLEWKMAMWDEPILGSLIPTKLEYTEKILRRPGFYGLSEEWQDEMWKTPELVGRIPTRFEYVNPRYKPITDPSHFREIGRQTMDGIKEGSVFARLNRILLDAIGNGTFEVYQGATRFDDITYIRLPDVEYERIESMMAVRMHPDSIGYQATVIARDGDRVLCKISEWTDML